MLHKLRIVQMGHARAAAVCTRLFVDLGASVEILRGPADESELARGTSLLDEYLNLDKLSSSSLASKTDARLQGLTSPREEDLLVLSDAPAVLSATGLLPAQLEAQGLNCAVAYITPFGLTGPKANEPACDLTLACASGIAQVLTGQVDDVDEAPVRAVGEQSAFIAGLAAACAAMQLLVAAVHQRESTSLRYVDVSMQEALATLDIQTLTRAGLGSAARPRQRHSDGNGATVTILPCNDGYVAISARENHQWTAWLEVMGSPEVGQRSAFCD